MAWVVDTSVLLDIRLNDPNFGIDSATCLARQHSDGLILCPVTYIELAPAFRGELPLQQAFSPASAGKSVSLRGGRLSAFFSASPRSCCAPRRRRAGRPAGSGAWPRQVGINWMEPWHWQDTQTAHKLWADHVTNKRAGHAAKRPVADVLIEAFALRFQGLITRNPKHFRAVCTLVP